MWQRITKFDPRGAKLADRHYSRRKVGSPQFMPPGETVILLSSDEKAVFGWWRPHPASGIKAMNGLDGWTCTIFRNEGNELSSSLILAAEQFLIELGVSIGPSGLITYVWDKKVKSSNPGACFKAAGWKRTGRSADGKKTLLQKSILTEENSSDSRRTIPGQAFRTSIPDKDLEQTIIQQGFQPLSSTGEIVYGNKLPR
jgi:hypothetical protein